MVKFLEFFLKYNNKTLRSKTWTFWENKMQIFHKKMKEKALKSNKKWG